MYVLRELTPGQLSGISPLPKPLPTGQSLQLLFQPSGETGSRPNPGYY